MSTLKQIEANRRNAQKSTGPRTESGRRASSLNAYKQLFTMTAEEAEAHALYTASMLQDLKPVGTMEETLARSLADTHWRLNRAVIIENSIFATDAFNQEAFAAREAEKLGTESQYDDVSRARAAAKTFFYDSSRFHLLTTYEARLHRKAQTDLKQLRDLQAARRAEEKATERIGEAKAGQKHNQQPPAQRPAPLRPIPTATQTTDLAELNPVNGFVCSSAGLSRKAIENYLMAAPPQYGIQLGGDFPVRL